MENKNALIIQPTDDALIVKIGGRFSGEFVFTVYKEVKRTFENNQKNVVLDFCGSEHADSMGLGTIVAINSFVTKRGNSMKMRGVSGTFMQLLKITNLTSILDIEPYKE